MLERETDNLGSRIRIQRSLNMLEKCYDVNKMDFSIREYEELHGVQKNNCTNAKQRITS